MVAEWPIRTDERSRRPAVARGLPRADAPARRLRDATADLYLPAANRVSDRVRASVDAMRDDLVGGIERDMRLVLAGRFADDSGLVFSLASPTVAIALPLLADAGTLARPPLTALLLRRAEEFVLAARLAPQAGGSGLPIDHADPAVANAATALVAARGRRLDRFGEPMLLPNDLDAELMDWLVWRIAAALRFYLVRHREIDASRADAAIVAAARARLSAHDEERGLHAAAAWFASCLAAQARVDGPMLSGLLRSGQIEAFVAVLAAVAAIPASEAWTLVTDPTDGRLALALRAAGADRGSAALILMLLIRPPGDAAAEIAFFDAYKAAEATAMLAPLALPTEYREAVRAMDAALVACGVRE